MIATTSMYGMLQTKKKVVENASEETVMIWPIEDSTSERWLATLAPGESEELIFPKDHVNLRIGSSFFILSNDESFEKMLRRSDLITRFLHIIGFAYFNQQVHIEFKFSPKSITQCDPVKQMIKILFKEFLSKAAQELF